MPHGAVQTERWGWDTPDIKDAPECTPQHRNIEYDVNLKRRRVARRFRARACKTDIFDVHGTRRFVLAGVEKGKLREKALLYPV